MTRAAPEPAPLGFKAAEALDPALLRFIEALARAHADEDYAAAKPEEARGAA